MNNKKNSGQWFKLPASVLFYDNKVLPNGAKLLYAYVLSLSINKGYCYADNKHFTKTLGFSDRSLNRYFTKLLDLNFIDVQIERNHKNRKIFPLVF